MVVGGGASIDKFGPKARQGESSHSLSLWQGELSHSLSLWQGESSHSLSLWQGESSHSLSFTLHYSRFTGRSYLKPHPPSRHDGVAAGAGGVACREKRRRRRLRAFEGAERR